MTLQRYIQDGKTFIWVLSLGSFEIKGRRLLKGARLKNGFPHIGTWNIAWGRIHER